VIPRWLSLHDVAKRPLYLTETLTELVQASVCLGRSPGMRAKDINSAFKIATGMKVPGIATF
jgi:hypothetical protein